MSQESADKLSMVDPQTDLVVEPLKAAGKPNDARARWTGVRASTGVRSRVMKRAIPALSGG